MIGEVAFTGIWNSHMCPVGTGHSSLLKTPSVDRTSEMAPLWNGEAMRCVASHPLCATLS